MERRVSVFGCGVQKGGTTTLHAYLADHPGLSAPARKETHFFDDETQDWSAPDYGALHALYSPDDGADFGLRQRFDITPVYLYWPQAMARLHAYNPQARLILLFRCPLKRAYSHWRMSRARGHEKLGFSEALAAEPARLHDAGPVGEGRRLFSYVDRGRYGAQLERALQLFPRDQMLLLRAEDLFAAPGPTLARVTAFLDIAPLGEVAPKHEMSRRSLRPPPLPTKADLALVAQALGDDLARFAELSGLDVSGWMQPPAAPAPPQRHGLARLWRR